MAGLSINPADIAKARESGYSDDEITNFLSARAPDQFKAAHDAGYSSKEILSHLTGDDSKPSGVAAGAFHGLAEEAKGVASTLKTYFGSETPKLDAAAAATEPENYHGAQVLPEGSHWYDPRTYHFGAIPQAVAEAVPGMATDIAAAKVASKLPVVGKFAPAAGIASYLLRTRGDAAKHDAEIRTGNPDAEPETQDKVRSALTGAAESVPQVMGISRFLPGSGVVKSVGDAGVKAAVKEAVKTGLTDAGAGAASNAIGQAGATIGTPGGLQVNPNQVAESAITSGAVGQGLALPHMLGEIRTAKKLEQFGGDNQKATEAMVKRVNDAADGGSLHDTGTAFESLRTADEGVRDELKQAVKPIKSTLDAETADAIKRATKGRTLTDSDLQTIEENTTPDVAFLARQAHVSSLIKKQGDYGNGDFVGGYANSVAKHVRALQNPVGAAVSAGLGATIGGGHAASLFAYGPETLAAIGGSYAALKLLDKATGTRSPMASLAERFQTPDATTRLPAPAPQQAPEAPQVTSGPTGPNVPFNPGVANGNALLATGASPWAREPAPEPAPAIDPLALPADLTKKSKTITDALRKVQAMREANTPPAPTPTPVIDPLALPKDVVGKSKTILNGLQNVADMREAASPPPVQETPAPPQINPLALPKDLTSQAKNLTSALRLVQEMRNKAEAKTQVDQVASESPLVNDAGGLGAISNPQVGKQASAYVSAANALKKLMHQPEEEAPPQATGIPGESQPTTMSDILQNVANATKAAGKISKKKGESKVTAEVTAPEAPAADAPYAPIPEDQLWRKGLSNEQVAERELGKYEPDVRKKYSKNVIVKRQKLHDTLETLANGFEDHDSTLAGKLWHELDHISRRSTARKALDFWTSKMEHPESRQAVYDALTPLMSKFWTKE